MADSDQKNITFSFTNADDPTLIKYYNDNLPQGVGQTDEVLNAIQGEFNPISLVRVGSFDSLSGGTTSSGTFTISLYPGNTAFNFLAIHLGLGELVFNWNTRQFSTTARPVSLTISGLTHELSNYRAYLDDTLPDDFHITKTPVPAGIWLFGSGILGLIGFRKKMLETKV